MEYELINIIIQIANMLKVQYLSIVGIVYLLFVNCDIIIMSIYNRKIFNHRYT